VTLRHSLPVRRHVTPLIVAAALIFGLVGFAPSSSGAATRSVKACVGGNLAGALASSDLYAGGAIIVLAITNTGTSACHLSGYPRLLGIRDGHEFSLSHVGEGTQDRQLNSTTLLSRQAGALILNTSLGCNANVSPLPVADEYTGVVILLPHQRGRVKISGVPLYVPCGLSESQLGWAKGFVFD
jgi:hypothetical protein